MANTSARVHQLTTRQGNGYVKQFGMSRDPNTQGGYPFNNSTSGNTLAQGMCADQTSMFHPLAKDVHTLSSGVGVTPSDQASLNANAMPATDVSGGTETTTVTPPAGPVQDWTILLMVAVLLLVVVRK